MPPRTPAPDLNSAVARDVMTARVITVAADDPIRSAAQALFDNNVGAAPVMDGDGVPVGMASDGDLLGRRPPEARRSWWLDALARAAAVPEIATTTADRPVRDVMTTPLISVAPTTPAGEIVHLLRTHQIKRLPVIEGGKLVGVVSRADLIELLERHLAASAQAADTRGGFLDFLESLVPGPRRPSPAERLAALEAESSSDEAPPDHSAESFAALVAAAKRKKSDSAAEAARLAAIERQRQVKTVLDERVSEAFWRGLLDHARQAAEQGEEEFLLLRFPAAVCSDGGRKIDVAEEGWEQTLRGEAAELYARWEHELKDKGIGLDARIVSFQDGVIGDLGLFLTWSSAAERHPADTPS